jgi:hypothetical protein
LGNQIDVQEYGAFAVYEASGTFSSACHDAIAYRNGLGRVAFMRTTIPKFGKNQITLIPTKKKLIDTGNTAENKSIQLFEDKNIIVATHTQASPEWFFARRFRITGTDNCVIYCFIDLRTVLYCHSHTIINYLW